jgi:adenosylcobinamide-GDP ribazoletransferase
MLLLLVFGRPADERSSSSYFVRSLAARSRRVAALVLALALPPLVALALGPPASLVALAAPALTGVTTLALSTRVFGGISGDVAGATGELARAVLLVALSARLVS